MKEYRVTWQQCPHIHHTPRVLFVGAGSADDAKALARDHIERRHGISWFSVKDVSETQPVPAGTVREG